MGERKRTQFTGRSARGKIVEEAGQFGCERSGCSLEQRVVVDVRCWSLNRLKRPVARSKLVAVPIGKRVRASVVQYKIQPRF